MSEGDASAFLREMSTAIPFQPASWFQLGIADRASDELIGDLGVCLDSDGLQAHLGFSLRVASQRQGYATEAVLEAISLLFESTDAVRVAATADVRNAASIALLQRVGMREVSTVKAVFRGQPYAETTYAMTRREVSIVRC